MDVFIGIRNNKNNLTEVFKARNYQSHAYRIFMLGNKKKKKFYYPNNIIFILKKMNTEGLKRDYSRFAVLVNELGEEHILSDNEELLRGFVGWKNRLTLVPI